MSDMRCKRCGGMVPSHLDEIGMCVPCLRDSQNVRVAADCRICGEKLQCMCDVNDLTHPRCRELGPVKSVNLSEAFLVKS